MAVCPLPWFPIYAMEMLGDGDFQVWTPEERGCWITLSARCWVDGSIPENLDHMAKLCGCNAEAMLKHWPSIASKFSSSETPGRLISNRIEIERQKAIEKSEKLKERGQAGATARWMKEKIEMPKQCLSMSQAMLVDATSPSPSPINTPLPPTGGMKPKRLKKKPEFSPEIIEAFEKGMERWPSEQPDGKAAPYSPKSACLVLFAKLCASEPIQAKTLALCMAFYCHDQEKAGRYVVSAKTFLGPQRMWADFLGRATAWEVRNAS